MTQVKLGVYGWRADSSKVGSSWVEGRQSVDAYEMEKGVTQDQLETCKKGGIRAIESMDWGTTRVTFETRKWDSLKKM